MKGNRFSPGKTLPSMLILLCLGGLGSKASLAGPAYDPPLPTPQDRELLHKQLRRIAEPKQSLSAADQALLLAQDDMDVTHYFLVLEFRPSAHNVVGSVTVSATSLVPGFQHVVLDLFDNMNVTAVTRGATSLAFTHSGNLLDITLDQPFGPGQSFDVKVTYNGVPDVNTGSIGWNQYSDGTSGAMIWTLSEPDGARVWWPCKDRPDDKATVEEWWTVPNTWTATGNGVLLGTVPVSGGRTQYKWKPTRPLTTYLVSIAGAAYDSFSDTYTTLSGGTMPLVHYVYHGTLAQAQESFSPTPSMIHFFAQAFGEYPFVEDKYGMSAFPFGGAMEHTTNTSYGYTLINGGHDYDFIIAHELSHQWFGDSVSPDTWADVWLNEGSATYCEALWYEHVNGAQGYQDYMNSLWRSHFNGPVYNNPNLFGASVYDKGSWVHHMLRRVMGGQQPYFDALRDWYTTHRDGVGSTAQFQAVMEAHYGGSLAWFFDEWVYGQNSPAYEYGFTTRDRGNGTYRTYVRIRQVQTDAGTFTMPVDLTLVTASGNQVRTVTNTTADEDFALDTTEPVLDVLFDEKDWILKASETRITLPDADGDGAPDRAGCASEACDCAPADPSLWAAPGEATDLAFASRSTLVWSSPAVPGGTLDSFDLLRSGSSSSFSTPVCIATGTTANTADDSAVPAVSSPAFYLVRAKNGCGANLGTRSDGTPRSAGACP